MAKIRLTLLIVLILFVTSYSFTFEVKFLRFDQNFKFPVSSALETSKPKLLWTFTPENFADTYSDGIDLSLDGKYAVVGVRFPVNPFPGFLYILNSSSQIPEWSLDTGDNGAIYSGGVSISADGQYITAGCGSGDIYLINRIANYTYWKYTATGEIHSVAISDDGNYIVVGDTSVNGRIYLFSKNSSNPIWTYSTNSAIRDVVISSNGYYIAAGNHAGKIFFFIRQNSTPIWTYSTGDNIINLAMSSMGDYLVGGSSDNNIYFFNTSSSNPSWEYHFSSLGGVDMSSDGEYIVTHPDHSDEGLKLFNRLSPIPIWTNNITTEFRSLTISADGNYIAATNVDNNVYFFNRTSSTPKWEYNLGTWALENAHLSFNGDKLLFTKFNSVFLFDMVSNEGDPDLPYLEIPFGNYFILILGISILYFIATKRKKIHFI